MKEIQIETKLTFSNLLMNLPQSELEYMNQAFEIRKKAYAPYSKFTVGTSIVLDNGIVVQGSNQENAAYPSGLCAERVAIFYAGANYPDA
jgi:cytidine deaminase